MTPRRQAIPKVFARRSKSFAIKLSSAGSFGFGRGVASERSGFE
jgi:hypothetical protein